MLCWTPCDCAKTAKTIARRYMRAAPLSSDECGWGETDEARAAEFGHLAALCLNNTLRREGRQALNLSDKNYSIKVPHLPFPG